MNRLFEIVYILLEKKHITAKELAERFEVSTRTIYRDIETLSIAGIPIYTTKGKEGGIHLVREFVLDKSMFNEAEQNEILFSLQSLKELQIEEKNSNVLQKISAIFQRSRRDWICIDFSSWGNSIEEKENFKNIKEAIWEQKQIFIEYYSSDGTSKKRKIEPMQFVFKNKAWYLKAYCLLKEDFRLFKLSRIQELEVTDERFERKEEREEQREKVQELKVPIVNLQLQIDKDLGYRVYDEFDKKDIKITEKGDYLISVSYPEDEWVYGYLLSFGEKIKIQKPEAVREKLQEKIKKMSERINEK